jgi:ring-1,2-phenylacetyl-CoA epoxidase subunit PaaD
MTAHDSRHTQFYAARKHIASLLQDVHDPEIPGVSIIDLGMVIDIRLDEDHWKIDLAPTYTGCPAIDVIPMLAKSHLRVMGYTDVDVEMKIAPPWSTDWISESGRQLLHEYGIAPPEGQTSRIREQGKPKACPQCGSASHELISNYGATACKAIYRCNTCQETFDYFKCY